MWAYLKTIGMYVIAAGLLIFIAAMAAIFGFGAVSVAVSWASTVGIYFIAAGALLFLLGCAAESKKEKEENDLLKKGNN